MAISKMKKTITTLFLAITFISMPVIASIFTEENISIGKASRIIIESKELGENRSLLVHLPKNYSNSSKSYPVLYLIDGGRHFNHAITSTRLLQDQKRIPELIIVAVSNNAQMHHDPDMPISKFTRFIKNEVMVYIDKNYKTSGLNTLFGQTKAGWFTAETLANHPELFRNYIFASAPLQDDEVKLYNKILENGKQENAQEKSLYFAVTNEAEEPHRYTDAFNYFVKLLTEKPPEKLDWHHEFFPNQTHITTSIPSLFNGLTHVFNSYQAPLFASHQEYLDFGGMRGLESHYQKRAQIYGTSTEVPEDTRLHLADMLFTSGKQQISLELYQALTNDFPESAASFSGLGQVYHSIKQYDKSIKAHQTAIKLANKLNPLWQQQLFQYRLDMVNKELNN